MTKKINICWRTAYEWSGKDDVHKVLGLYCFDCSLHSTFDYAGMQVSEDYTSARRHGLQATVVALASLYVSNIVSATSAMSSYDFRNTRSAAMVDTKP